MIKFFSTFARNIPSAKARARSAEDTINEMKILWNSGKLNDALDKVDEIERDHPSYSKAAKVYRGKIGYELLVKSGNLPQKPSFK